MLGKSPLNFSSIYTDEVGYSSATSSIVKRDRIELSSPYMISIVPLSIVNTAVVYTA